MAIGHCVVAKCDKQSFQTAAANINPNGTTGDSAIDVQTNAKSIAHLPSMPLTRDKTATVSLTCPERTHFGRAE